MLLALTGAHSTGKTTLLENLKKEDLFKDYVFLTELTRFVNKEGYAINEQGNEDTQSRIMNLHLKNLNHKNAIMDRCFLDGIVYTDYLHQNNKINLEVFNKCLKLFQENIIKYDRLFYMEPELPLVEDGIRSINTKFRSDIINLFNFYIDYYYLPVINISGNLKDRVNQIILNVGEDSGEI